MSVPRRVATFVPWAAIGLAGVRNAAVRDPATGIITCTNAISVAGSTGPSTWHTVKWLEDGTVVAPDLVTVIALNSRHQGNRNLNTLWFGNNSGFDPAWWYSANAAGVPIQGTDISSELARLPVGPDIYQNGWIYTTFTTGGFVNIRRWHAPGGVPGLFSGVLAITSVAATANELGLGTSDDGYIWAHHVSGAFPFGRTLIKYDENLNLVHQWTSADISATDLGRKVQGDFFVWNNLICFAYIPPSGIGNFVALVKVNDDFTLENYGVHMPTTGTLTSRYVTQLDGCLGIDESGTFTLCPEQQPIVWQSP